MKSIKLNNNELIKFIKVLGSYNVKMLWVDDKISLTSKQLDILIQWGKEHEEK